MEFTTLQVRKETRDRMKKHKIVSKENYDEIINRILNWVENERRTKNIILDKDENEELNKIGLLFTKNEDGNNEKRNN